jgi:hypothetical protein
MAQHLLHTWQGGRMVRMQQQCMMVQGVSSTRTCGHTHMTCLGMMQGQCHKGWCQHHHLRPSLTAWDAPSGNSNTRSHLLPTPSILT